MGLNDTTTPPIPHTRTNTHTHTFYLGIGIENKYETATYSPERTVFSVT